LLKAFKFFGAKGPFSLNYFEDQAVWAQDRRACDSRRKQTKASFRFQRHWWRF
jgi:hypothetical protein